MDTQNLKSTEKISVEKCKQFLKLNNSTIIKTFKLSADSKNQDGKSYFQDTSTYISVIKKWCESTIKNNGTNTSLYKKSQTNLDGRMYVKDFGIQRLSRGLRAWFCCDNYYDFDMANAHPTILFNYMCINHPDIKVPILEQYVLDRTNFLKKANINKITALVMLNSDELKVKNENTDAVALQTALFKNFRKCRKAITTGKELDENAKNPISSYVNKLLCELENEILINSAVEIDIPMFDGFMINKNKINSVDETINNLNNTDISKKYNIKWTEKPIDNIIKIIHCDDPVDTQVDEGVFLADDYSYEAVKYRLEQEHFIIESPQILIKEFINYKGAQKLNMLDIGGFKLLTAPYQYDVPVFDKKGNVVDNNKKSVYDKWIKDTARRSYKELLFYPKIIENKDYYNIFKGFNVEQQILPSYQYNGEAVERFLDLVSCICGGDQESIEYLLNWAAHLIQKPEERPLVAILIKSVEGVGKDTFREYLEKIIGSDYVFTTDKMDSVIGNFNPNIGNKLLIQINEAKSFDAHSSAAALKHLITTPTIEVNQKNVKSYKLDNYARLLLFSNECNVINVTAEDRRYVIIKSGNKRDQDFYQSLYNDLADKNVIKSVFDYLILRDISQFKFTKRPINKAYTDMVKSNTNPIYEFIYNKCNESEKPEIRISQADLFNEYESFLIDNGIGQMAVNRKSVKGLLCDLGMEIKLFKINGKAMRGMGFNRELMLVSLKDKYTPPEEVIISDEESDFIEDELD